jgi:hypothetical protein
MAAGSGFKTFATGDVLTAADTNGYLMQGVWVFADAAARTAAVTSPQEGNMSYLKDTNSTEYYSGSAWTAVGGSTPGLTLINTTSFSAVSSQQVNSIFSSTYSSYRIFLKLSAASASDATIKLALRISSDVDATSGTILTAANVTVTGASATGRLGSVSATYPGLYTCVCDLMSPNLADKTQGVANGFYATNGGVETTYTSGFGWFNNTQYTGLTLIPSLGTITGTVQIYGYKA